MIQVIGGNEIDVFRSQLTVFGNTPNRTQSQTVDWLLDHCVTSLPLLKG